MSYKQQRIWGAVFCGSAVILGAIGAHYLKTILSTDYLNSFHTGVQYQFFHGIALIAIRNDNKRTKLMDISIFLFTIGTVLFSGSIYTLCYLNTGTQFGLVNYIVSVTPIGGLIIIFGWVCLAIEYFRL